ncbi:MAG: MotA/TolQ/ExbB proton channel family protein [Cetobacterium sp.]
MKQKITKSISKITKYLTIKNMSIASVFMLIVLIFIGYSFLRTSNKSKILSIVNDRQTKNSVEENYLKKQKYYKTLEELFNKEVIEIKNESYFSIDENISKSIAVEVREKLIVNILEENGILSYSGLKKLYLQESHSRIKYLEALNNLEIKGLIRISSRDNIVMKTESRSIKQTLPNENTILKILDQNLKNEKVLTKQELENLYLDSSVSKENMDIALNSLKIYNKVKELSKDILKQNEDITFGSLNQNQKKIISILYKNRDKNISEQELKDLFLIENFEIEYQELLKDNLLKEGVDGIIYRENTFSSNELFFLIMSVIFLASIFTRICRDYKNIGNFVLFEKNIKEIDDYYDFNKSIEIIEKDSTIKKAWKKYIETLKEKYETIDPDYFINFDILYKDEIRYRLFAHIPQIILGLGMLGTFYGLSIGLSQLDLSNVDSIQSGVGELLSGVKTAFYTSLFGLGFSILFSFWINFYFSEIEKIITKIKNEANKFKIKSSEKHPIDKIIDSLEGIKNSNSKMTETLTNQIEVMSESLNKSIGEFSNNIGGNFKDGLSDALDKVFNEDFMGNLTHSLDTISEVFLENSEKMLIFKDEVQNSINELAELKDSYSDVIVETINLKVDFNDTMENINTNLYKVVSEVSEVAQKYEQTSSNLENVLTVLATSQDSSIKILEENKDVMRVATTLLDSSKDILDAEKSVQELWNSYEDSFKEINYSLSHNLDIYKVNLEETVIQLRGILRENSNEYNSFIKNVTVDYTNEVKKGMINLFTDYDGNLSTVINKFNGVLLNFNEKMEDFTEIMLETKEMIEEHVEILNQEQKGEE